jgi:hypothetical protein
MSLAGVTHLPESEQGVNDWYSTEVANLEALHENGKLRQEQFKRKKALLRVEYWAKLDKIRNNATPTVIG